MSFEFIIDGDYIVEFLNSSGVALIRFYPVKNYYSPMTFKVSDFTDIYSDYVAEVLSGNFSGAEVFLNVSRGLKGNLLLKWSSC
jgi:hypothetical protein